VRGAEGRGGFGDGTRNHRLGRGQVAECHQALTDHVRELDAGDRNSPKPMSIG
jgi:hypothetical protein